MGGDAFTAAPHNKRVMSEVKYVSDKHTTEPSDSSWGPLHKIQILILTHLLTQRFLQIRKA